MNNLKRILSLALASVMLVGMMVVGASAKEFTDDETIANTDAVDTLVALNVIGGYDDGSFRPEGNVTRAQMAKMIAVALHGGDEDFRGSSSGSQFTDVKDGMWYTKFINYCAGEGIINGRNATTFDPEGNVTATETAVMIMRAMGYRNETFLNEKGVYSPAAVDKLAETLGLYDDTTSLTDTSVALNRQNAAQVICNAIQLPTPVYRMTYNSEGVRTWSLESTDGKTVLENAYKANIEYGLLKNTAYTAKTEEYTYTIDSTAEKVAPFQGTTDKDGKVTGKADAKVTTKADASDLFMQRVKVVYSGNLVLSITPASNNVLGEGVVANMKKTQNEGKTAYTALDGYEFDASVVTGKTINYTLFNGITGKSANNYDTYTLIDNDGDNKIDAIVVNPVTVSQVASVSKTQVGLGVAGTAKFESVDDIYEGIARDDWAITCANGKGGKTVVKLDVIENVQATVSKEGVYTIGGEKYKAVGTALDDVTLGKSYNLVALNGYVFFCDPYSEEDVAAGLEELVYAVAVGDAVQALDALGNKVDGKYSQKVQLLFANGKEAAVVEVTNLSKTGDTSSTKTGINDTDRMVTEKTLYTYSVNKNGTYTLAELKLDDDGKWNKLTVNEVAKASNAIADGKAGSIRFNDDAVIFVAGTIDGDFDAKIVTGAEVNTWDDTDLEKSTLYTSSKNGFPYAVTGILNVGTRKAWPGAPASSDKYGYLIADADNYYVADLEGTYVRLQIWTGSENVVRYADKSTTLADYTAGTMISYKENNDGTLPKDGGLTKLSPEALAVSAYAGGNDIQFSGDTKNEYNLKDTVVIYIDDAENEGAEATAIQIADTDEFEDGTKYSVNNVYVVKGDKKALTVMFVDVNNKIAVQPKAPAAHVHTMSKTPGTPATCAAAGTVDTWTCSGCGKTFIDEDGNTEATDANKVDPIDSNNHTNMAWVVITQDMIDDHSVSGTAGQHIQYCDGCHATTGSAHDATETDADVYGDCTLSH